MSEPLPTTLGNSARRERNGGQCGDETGTFTASGFAERQQCCRVQDPVAGGIYQEFVFGEKICTQYRLVNSGLDERNIRKVAAAERNRFADFSPRLDASTIRAGERRSVCCGRGGLGTGVRKDADRRPRIYQKPCAVERIS